MIVSINGRDCTTSTEAVAWLKATEGTMTLIVSMPNKLPKGAAQDPASKKKEPNILLAAYQKSGMVLDAQWTNEETQLIITLDEKHSNIKPQTKYKIMADLLPRWNVNQCQSKVYMLRRWVNDGIDILGSILFLSDIKTTLAKWSKDEIDLLMKHEQQLQGQDEGFQNAKIEQVLPRWNRDRCSFKTVYMRWHTTVQELTNTKKKRKAQLEADRDEKKKRSVSEAKEQREAMEARQGAVIPAPPKTMAPLGGHGTPSPAVKAKIDANFADVLNNDPYLQNQGEPQTLEDLVT